MEIKRWHSRMALNRIKQTPHCANTVAQATEETRVVKGGTGTTSKVQRASMFYEAPRPRKAVIIARAHGRALEPPSRYTLAMSFLSDF